MTFRQKLNATRRGRGFTLQALSDATGIHKSVLSRWETGSRNVEPSVSQLLRLAAALGVKPSTLLDGIRRAA